jgi:hypothetical protein
MTRDVFLNRPAHVYYKPGDRDAGIYDEMKLLTPTDWQAQKHSFEKSTARDGSALGAPVATAAPAAAIGGGAPAIGGAAYSAAPAAPAPTNNGMAGLTPNQLIAQLGQAK